MLILTALGVGILTGLSPCIYPLIPSFLGIWARLGRKHPYILTLSFLVTFILVYSLLGLLAVATGMVMGSLASTTAFHYVVSGLILLAGLSLLLNWELRIPVPQLGTGFTGVFTGGVLAIATSACGTPMLISMLLMVAETKNYLTGMILLSTYAIGTTIPFLLIAFTGYHLIPRAGKWLNYVRIVTGLILVVVSIVYFV